MTVSEISCIHVPSNRLDMTWPSRAAPSRADLCGSLRLPSLRTGAALPGAQPLPSELPCHVQLKGYAAAKNVRGTVFLETIGINADDLTTDIIVNDCYYLGLVSEQSISCW